MSDELDPRLLDDAAEIIAEVRKASGKPYIEKKLINGQGPFLYKRQRVGGTLTSTYIGKLSKTVLHAAPKAGGGNLATLQAEHRNGRITQSAMYRKLKGLKPGTKEHKALTKDIIKVNNRLYELEKQIKALKKAQPKPPPKPRAPKPQAYKPEPNQRMLEAVEAVKPHQKAFHELEQEFDAAMRRGDFTAMTKISQAQDQAQKKRDAAVMHAQKVMKEELDAIERKYPEIAGARRALQAIRKLDVGPEILDDMVNTSRKNVLDRMKIYAADDSDPKAQMVFGNYLAVMKHIDLTAGPQIRNLLHMPGGKIKFEATDFTHSPAGAESDKVFALNAKDALKWYNNVTGGMHDHIKVKMSNDQTKLQKSAGEYHDQQRATGNTATIYVKYPDTSTMIHEMGHAVEDQSNPVKSNSKLFSYHRSAEKGGNDKYMDRYAAKTYPHGSTELISVGASTMYNDPVAFFLYDRDHFELTLAALKGIS